MTLCGQHCVLLVVAIELSIREKFVISWVQFSGGNCPLPHSYEIKSEGDLGMRLSSLSLSYPGTSYSALTTVSEEDFQDSDIPDVEVTWVT